MDKKAFKGKIPYEAPMTESVAIHIEAGFLTGTQVEKTADIEDMDMTEDEYDW